MTSIALRFNTTERNFLSSVGLLLASVAVFGFVYALEMRAGLWSSSRRFVFEPAETAMRYVGIAHFLVAFVYSLTSKRMRSPKAWGAFAGLLAVGSVLCLGFARIEASSAPLGALLFLAYFLVHDYRDQVFFYFRNGDAPKNEDPARVTPPLVAIPFLALGAVASVLAVGGALGVPAVTRHAPFFAVLPPLARAFVGIAPSVVVALGVVWFGQRIGAEPAPEFLRRHRPILMVFAVNIAILFIGLSLGWRTYTVVILHVVSWYIFALTQMRRYPPKAPPSGWQWLRSTPTGFRWIHIGIFAICVAAGVFWAYRLGNDPALAFRLILDKNAFVYWTILHVTVSFGAH